MQCIIEAQEGKEWQSIGHEWYGLAVQPAFRYRFSLAPEGLLFRAARAAAAQVHPEAIPGRFQPDLWKFDAAEFFLAREDASRYLEFNLSPNGAWWACVFSAPRVPDPAMAGWFPHVVAEGCQTPFGWESQALLPMQDLACLGIGLGHCRLAACAILESPQQIFLTTAEGCTGEPDFHLPQHWPIALCQKRKK